MTFLRRGGIYAFLALGLVGFALPRAADAAAKITATPSEAIFYVKSPNIVKSIEIAWDADGASEPPRAVYYTINGANETLFATTNKGVKTADFIKFDNVYEFCLWGKNHKDKIVCTTVTTKHKEVKLQFGFIHNVKPEPGGHSVRIRFSTDRATLPVVQVSETAPNKIPPFSDEDVAAFPANAEVKSQFAGAGFTHESVVAGLKPDTDHFFVIAAADKKTGLWFKLKGKFHTHRRAVNVTFDKVKIVDDSDDLSAGDLLFGFFINGQNAPNGKAMNFGTHANTNATKTANVKGSVAGAPPTLTLKVVGYDDDETEWIPLGPFVVILMSTCGTSATDPALTEGEDDCGEWSSDSASFNLTTLAANAPNPENFTQSFKIEVRPQGDDSEVAFDASGSFRVTFVP